MKLIMTRHGLRIESTDQPIDDIFIEEVLNLYNEGDCINLVKTPARGHMPYALVTMRSEEDHNEEKNWITKATALFYQYREESEKYSDVKELCLMYAGKATALYELLEMFGAKPKKTNDEIPLPCPFCGKIPTLTLQPESKGGAWGKIACINPQCPTQPEICDDRRVVNVEDPKLCKSVIISLWNKRAKC